MALSSNSQGHTEKLDDADDMNDGDDGDDNDDDIKMKPTTRTLCPTLLRKGTRFLSCAPLHRQRVTHHGLW